MTDKLVVFVTVPNRETAVKIAETVVIEKLAACANIVPGIESIYEWKSRIEKSSELLMLFKTRVELYKHLEERILKLHPYEVPEIVAVPIGMGSLSYLQWIDQVVGKPAAEI